MRSSHNIFLRVITTLNILSVDVVAGALAGAVMAVQLTDAKVGWAFWICLGLTVWIVYTADHLFDAMRVKERAQTARHGFHYRHRKVFLPVLLSLSMITIILAFLFLENIILWFGIALGAIIGLYLSALFLTSSKPWPVPKEVFVATFYSIGIWGGPLLLMQHRLYPLILLLPFSFSLLALADLLILSIFDASADRQGGFRSFALTFGISVTRYTALAVIFLSVAIDFIILLAFHEAKAILASILLIMMGIALVLHLLFTRFFSKNNRYRYLNEVVFLFPGIMIF